MAGIRITSTNLIADVLGNTTKAKNIEISVYNWTINYIKNNPISISKTTTKKKKNTVENNNSKDWTNSRFDRNYKRKIRSVLFNLRDTNNPEFLEQVKNGSIQTVKIVNMSPEEINPNLWEPFLQKQLNLELRAIKEDELILNNATEGQYTCNKCKCRKIHHYGLQTRSADEPMTLYFTCLKCNNRWKE